MIRNFVTGVLMGGVVAGAGLGVVSQLTPLERGQGAEVAAADKDAKPPAETLDPQAPVTGLDSPGAMAEAPVVEPLEPSPPGDALLAPTAEAGQPAPASIAPQLPDAPTPPEDAPTADETAAAPAIGPDANDVDAAATELKPVEGTNAGASGGAVAGTAAPEGNSAETEVEIAAAPGAEPEPQTPDAPALTPEPAPGASAEAAPEAAAEIAPGLPEETAPDAVAEVAPEPAPDAAPEPALDAAPDAAPEPAPEPAVETVVPDQAMPVLTPDAGLQDKEVAGVTTGRLPAITADAPQDVAPEGAAIDPSTLPPVQRFARDFTNTAAKPLFAVLLLDPGTAELNRAELAALPFAVTFVIDPMAPNAAEAAAIYRAGGQEVVMLASGIPKGATAADLEQSFASLDGAVPEAVALIDTSDATFQDNRGLAAEVVTLLAAQGRGLVTFDRGLNAADQVARREEVPAATIFRSLDDDGEDAPLIRRYLDRAAFKAAQEGSVVVIGTARANTIAALMEWAIEGRSASVALAPITAVMAAN